MKINYQLFILALGFSLLSVSLSVNGQGTTKTNVNSGGGANVSNYKTNWNVNPFDPQVFVENKGQFDTMVTTAKVLYGVKQGPMYAYFTPNGMVYRYDEYSKVDKDAKNEAGDPDMSPPPPAKTHVLSATWVGSNPGVTVSATDEQSDYYTYAKGKNDAYKVNIFKKITYTNLYPGIDAEFVFPEGKTGFKYTLIVHPGANPNVVKLQYDGDKSMQVDNDGNMQITSGWGEFTDHTPVAYYADDHSSVVTKYNLDAPSSTESFNMESVNSTKTLMIDPWVTNWTNVNPIVATSGYDGCYDLDYDYNGDVWVYGGWSNLQLVKFNSLGVKQWTYNTNNAVNGGYYGDFSIDKFDGNAYLVQGFSGGGAVSEKVNYLGALTGTAPPCPNLEEFWRVVFDPCHRVFVVGGGGFSNVQDCVLDTTMLAAPTPVNVLNALPGQDTHDMCFAAPDPTGTWAYTASAKSLVGDPLHFDNYVQQMVLPTLAPTNYNLADGYGFIEVGSITYVGAGVGEANGMNGMAASLNWLYLFDGATLKQLNKTTGALNNSVVVSGTSYSWGGLDVDNCDNVYAGNSNNIDVYNSTLAQTGTIGPLTSTVYDVVLNSNFVTLYACGKGFLTSIAVTPPVPPTITKQVVNSNCFCSGECKATLMLCGNPDTVGVTYRWSNGQTTRTATNLCAGIDTVTISLGVGCLNNPASYKDTVKIGGGASQLTVVRDSSAATCATLGMASVAITGGTAPYTYKWSTGATTSSINAGAGNYCVTYADNTGCKDSLCITITGALLPTITVAPNPDTVCLGSGVLLTANGGVTYSWLPGAGLSCNNCSSATATPNVTTTYTVTGTDGNGCSNTTSVQVVVEQPPVVTITPQNDTICPNGSVVLTAAGAVTYSWAPSAGLSCTACASPTANPTVTTSYTVIGTNAHGCTSTANVTVFLGHPPTINVSASRNSICLGTSVDLIASATNTTSPFTWQPGPLSGPIVAVTPTITTTYTVTASSTCGTASATVTINVNDLPSPSFGADVTNGCYPLCIQFRDKSTSTSGTISQWEWKFGNGDTSDSKNPIYCYPNAGSFPVNLTIVSDSGCSATLNVLNYITVYSHPNAAFSLSPQPTDIMSPTIQFTDHSTDAYGITYWVWNFGETGDTLSYLQNPQHTYLDTGTYCASLVVMNVHGCVDTVTNCLIIDPIYTLYIPDAFTPNSNGLNDVFMAKGNDVKTFEMYIFDRWGMELFHSTDINDGWPGNVKGGTTIAQEDTYVYLINATDHKNKKHTYIGKVSLIK